MGFMGKDKKHWIEPVTKVEHIKFKNIAEKDNNKEKKWRKWKESFKFKVCQTWGIKNYTLVMRSYFQKVPAVTKTLTSIVTRQPNLRSSRLEIYCRKGVLKISQNLQKSTYVRVSFLKPEVSDTIVFLWILENFKEHPFLQIPSVTASET